MLSYEKSSKGVITLLTINNVSERLNVSERTVRNLIYSGKLPAFKIGGTYRINETDLNEFINSSKIKNEEKGD